MMMQPSFVIHLTTLKFDWTWFWKKKLRGREGHLGSLIFSHNMMRNGRNFSIFASSWKNDINQKPLEVRRFCGPKKAWEGKVTLAPPFFLISWCEMVEISSSSKMKMPSKSSWKRLCGQLSTHWQQWDFICVFGGKICCRKSENNLQLKTIWDLP